MQNTSPALEMLLMQSFSLLLGLPTVVWLFLHGNRDTGAKLWFVAVSINALAIVLLGYFRQFALVPALLFVVALLPAILSMRWELQHPPLPWPAIGTLLVAYALLQWWLEQAGMRMTVGYALNLFVLVTLECFLLVLVSRVSRLHRSRGLAVVALGIAMIALTNAYRLVRTVLDGEGSAPFSGSPATTIALVLITMVSVLHVVGYGGFVLEKLHRRRLVSEREETRALERQRQAERHAQAVQALVSERDEMILLNSRFSAVNSLALYNSAIVHEISQPLQALMSILDRISLYNPDGKDVSTTKAGIEQAMAMVQKMAATLATLRCLVGGHQPKQEVLQFDAELDAIIPILQTQAQRQKITLELNKHAHDAHVRVNRVLLQRLVFNFVTNAFEALEQDRENTKKSVIEPPRVSVSTKVERIQNQLFCVLCIQDNGPGFPSTLDLGQHLVLTTTKDLGMGIGLRFAQMIAESWRGELRAYNVKRQEGSGAVVELWLPAAEST